MKLTRALLESFCSHLNGSYKFGLLVEQRVNLWHKTLTEQDFSLIEELSLAYGIQ